MICVLYHSHDKVNGSLIDAFEYFIALLDRGADAYLVLVKSFSKNVADLPTLFSTFEDRYELSDLEWKSRVMHVKFSDLPAIKMRKALIVDYVTPSIVDGVLDVDDIVCIEEKPLNPCVSTRFAVKVFSEIRSASCVTPYKMRMLFERMKVPKESDDKMLVNVAGVYTPDRRFIEACGPEEVESFGKEYILKTGDHKENFFSLFDTYLYMDVGLWDDPHPRLFHECAFMGKEIHYVEAKGKSTTAKNEMAKARFADAKLNGPRGRWFDGDPVIEELMR